MRCHHLCKQGTHSEQAVGYPDHEAKVKVIPISANKMDLTEDSEPWMSISNSANSSREVV